MDSCPTELEPFLKAYRIKRKMQDEDMWVMGIYIRSAVTVSIEHCLNVNKAKSEYIKEPIRQEQFDNIGLTEEEIQEKELRKALIAEEQWMITGKQKGLPETII